MFTSMHISISLKFICALCNPSPLAPPHPQNPICFSLYFQCFFIYNHTGLYTIIQSVSLSFLTSFTVYLEIDLSLLFVPIAHSIWPRFYCMQWEIMPKLQSIYPFIYWWDTWIVLDFGYYQKSYYKYGCEFN